MDKIDLSKEHKDLYAASGKPKIVDAPSIKFLMYDGVGIPGKTPDFTEAMKALFSTAFTLKFTLKPSGKDFKVMAPEAVWKIGEDAKGKDPAKFEFTVMIPVPDFVGKADVEKAKKAVKEKSLKKKEPAPLVEKLRLESEKQGKCVQIMQMGPYDKAPETYKKLKAFAEESGYEIRGYCREIYYNDPNRVAKDKIKTLVRYPVGKK